MKLNIIKLPRIIWVILLLFGVWFIFSKLKIFPNIKNIFTASAVTIDNTPILITEVKKIAELMTVKNYDEIVVDTSINPFTNMTPLSRLENKLQLTIIAKGQIVAGIDLEELDSKTIFVSGDSVSMILPKAKIIDAIVNPSDFEIFIADGGFSDDAVKSIKVLARNKLIKRAVSQGLLNRAQEQAQLVMRNFLSTAGFTKITLLY